MATFLLSEKGRKKLFFNGFAYTKDYDSTNKTHWKCELRGTCKARAHTSTNAVDGAEVDVRSEHTHLPDARRISVVKTTNDIKRNANETQESTVTIITAAINAVSPVVTASLPRLSCLNRMARRQRQGNVPPQPQDLLHLEIPQEYRTTLDGAAFLLYDSGPGPQRILLFSTAENLALLERSQDWYGDGTFKVSPNLFYQLYTLHAFVNDSCVPLVYALLPDKRQETYVKFLEALSQQRVFPGPRTVMCDFELAPINAFKHVYPNAEIHGCLFHLSQNIFRKTQELGLQQRYAEDANFALKIKMLPALAFVPAQHVSNYFECLIENFPMEAIPISDYFEDNYIGRLRRNRRTTPLFPINIWNNYDRVLINLPRSNNSVEAWHRRFHCVVACDHPSIWRLLNKLQEEQSFIERRIEQLNAGHEELRRKKYADLDKRLKNVVERFEKLDELEYLRSIAHNLA